MNKLLLIGNGFDLAHGLPTSYKNFIDDIWKNLAYNYNDSEIKKVFDISPRLVKFLLQRKIENFVDFNNHLQKVLSNNNFSYRTDILFAEDSFKREVLLEVKNNFFILINSKNSIQNWVDIENVYYLELKKIVKTRNIDRVKKEKIIKLNKEFNEVKNLLIKYLREKILQNFDIEKSENRKEFLEMYNIFKPNSSLNDNEWIDLEFSIPGDWECIQEVYSKESESKKIKCYPYIVNFNYTNSAFPYYWEMNKSLSMENGNINNIHGEIDSEEFKPVFGFGDEMDDDYKLIEELDDNEYLKFFKSFQYFHNNTYDNLLREIDGEKFQAVILGHSCGLSDRVLLNTIFEHKNCRSIKIYYHQKEDGTDNYLDVVKNISRHFKDKPSMRRKIVSKELSSPLPQNVRFKKK
ncbi:AbiH family protein [uncultured Polaribacter sp.]|uniref:AbiH family protein n=1 Tax=uncultured Polaribacter sp. TaxID=174711 RepID=UPI0026136843|nr:AbiH family protein [uncultured Polaribacter sp.]